jgi:hypothetical protein
MPKSKQHWGHDLLALGVVAAIAVLVFWLVPVTPPGA